ERTPLRRTLADAYSSAPFTFEPVSSYVMTTGLAHRVGPWASAAETWRSPLLDWVLRIARSEPSFVSDPDVTTLKVNTHHDAARQGSGAHDYDRGAADHDALLDLMARVGPDGMRTVVASDLAAAFDRRLEVRDPDLPLGGGPRQAFERRLQDPASYERYR